MQPLPDVNELMKLAASPAGQQLMAMLKSDDTIDLKKLAQSASSGNLTDAKAQLSAFLASEKTKALLKQLEQPNE